MIKGKSKSLAETHPTIAAQWHQEINGSESPYNFSAGSGKKVWWQCPVVPDHIWQAAINERKKGRGCPCCSGLKVVTSNCLATTHPHIAAQWHFTKNGNIMPENVTAGSMVRIWWQCPVEPDHIWQTTPNQRTSVECKYNGNGCPFCSGRKVATSTCLTTTHSDIVAQWHPTKNGDKRPENFSAGSNVKIWWEHSCGCVWQSTIYNRTFGNGCPRCNQSKGEQEIEKFLQYYGINYQRQHKFIQCKNKRMLPFDFMVENDGKIKLIEYQGKHHYMPISFGGNSNKNFSSTITNDKIKRDWCAGNCIPLLEIPFWNFNEIPEMLLKFI